MKKAVNISKYFFALLILALACTEEQFPIFEEGEFVLRLNQPKTLVDGSVLELIEVEDSRCPENANCIWEGRAAVKVRWTREEVYEVNLNNVEYVTKQVENYLITLQEVTPYPTGTNSPEPVRVRVKIEQE